MHQQINYTANYDNLKDKTDNSAVVMLPVVEPSGHCGDCPFLEPYKHPFYHHTAWCWHQMKSLDFHDYWLAYCVDNEPDAVLL